MYTSNIAFLNHKIMCLWLNLASQYQHSRVPFICEYTLFSCIFRPFSWGMPLTFKLWGSPSWENWDGSFTYQQRWVQCIKINDFIFQLRLTYFLILQYSLHVFDQMMSAGGDYDMKLAGAYAVDTLRLEKGFRHWGHELDTETTPWEAGLGFAIDMSKVWKYWVLNSVAQNWILLSTSYCNNTSC